MKIKICHISTAHPTFDGRIFHKECKSLASAGYDVSLIIGHNKSETVDGVNIVSISKSKGRFKRFFIKSISVFFVGLKTKSKIFHLHDPELLITGILLKLSGKKVIFDMHELIFYQISDKDYLGNKFVRNIFARVYKLLESWGIRIFDKIVLAEDGYKNYFEKYYPKRLHKIVFIRNYPILSLINQKIDNNIKDKPINKTFTLAYAGSLSRIRGLYEICKVVNELNIPIRLVLMGIWSDDKFKSECLINNDKIIYKGILPLSDVYQEMNAADLGISLLYPVENYLTSLPVKAFEYMACGLPILMSDFPYWKEKFEGAAIFSNPNNLDEIKSQINWAFDNRDKLQEMGNFGIETVRRNYSWENEAETLVQTYAEFQF